MITKYSGWNRTARTCRTHRQATRTKKRKPKTSANLQTAPKKKKPIWNLFKKPTTTKANNPQQNQRRNNKSVKRDGKTAQQIQKHGNVTEDVTTQLRTEHFGSLVTKPKTQLIKKTTKKKILIVGNLLRRPLKAMVLLCLFIFELVMHSHAIRVNAKILRGNAKGA